MIRNYIVQGPVWFVFGFILRRIGYFQAQRSVAEEQIFQRMTSGSLAPQTVLTGPFAGLRYATPEACGSALWPKLLGTYEKELHEIINELCRRPYTLIADWGCAEGYFLVGMGRRIPTARLIGIDPDPTARELCRAMSTVNGIHTARLVLLSSAKLTDLDGLRTTRSLIISDCEGYENELLSGDLSLLAQSDLIIECHDHLVAETTQRIESRLSATHKITRIISRPRVVGDLESVSKNAINTRLTEFQIERLLSEGRPSAMTWLVAEPSPIR